MLPRVAEPALAGLIALALLRCGGSQMPAKPTIERSDALRALRYSDEEPPRDLSNAYELDARAEVFGQRLFFEPRLSGPLTDADNDGSEISLGRKGEAGRVSCAGCHIPTSGFVDTRSRSQQVSLGARWTMRRTPQLSEVAFAGLYNWDGGRDSIWRQAVGVMESDREFNAGRLLVARKIYELHRGEYESIFGPMPEMSDHAQFPDLAPEESGCKVRPGLILECRGLPGDGAEYDAMTPEAQDAVTRVAVNVGKAMAAYVRQIRCGSSRFDAWIDGQEDALTETERRGADVFVGRGKCVDCHSGPRLSDQKFHNVGLKPAQVSIVVLDANDRGAAEGFEIAKGDPLNTKGTYSDGDPGTLPIDTSADLEGAFRTPTLRCIDRQPSFMHTAQLRSIEEVIDFFDRGGDPSGYPGINELKPLGLTVEEKADLAAFIRALAGPGPDVKYLTEPAPF
jgi:cytochrome c peroxidase